MLNHLFEILEHRAASSSVGLSYTGTGPFPKGANDREIRLNHYPNTYLFFTFRGLNDEATLVTHMTDSSSRDWIVS